MRDGRTLLQRKLEEASVPEVTFEGFLRHRERAIRRQRLTAGVVAVAVAAVAIGVAFRAFDDRATVPAAGDRFAGVHGWIAYGGSQVVAIDPSDPSRQVSLTNDSGVVDAPLAWARDGSRLLVGRHPQGSAGDGAVDLVVLNADGTEVRVASDGVVWGGASFSPDGTEIVYTAVDKSVRIVGDDGTPARTVLDGHSNLGWYPQGAWSPDGSTIAYTIFPTPDGPFLWLMDADGSHQRRIADLSAGAPSFGGGVRGLQWSPDGQQLAFVLQAGANRGEVFTIRPNGSGESRLTRSGPMTWIGYPTWSPGGSRLAFMTNYKSAHPDVPNSIGVVDLDGSGMHVLFAGSDEGASGFIAWNPS